MDRQVEQGSCADPGSFVRRGGARRPENSLDNVFLVINLFYNLQSGSNGFITEGLILGGVQRNPYNLWFSREGDPDP